MINKVLYNTYDVLSGIKLAGINLNKGTVPLKFGLGREHFQTKAQFVTEIFNVSCAKSVAGPKTGLHFQTIAQLVTKIFYINLCANSVVGPKEFMQGY